MADKYYKEKERLVAFVKNFPNILWREGYWEAMHEYVERIGEEYAKKQTDQFRKLKIFSEKELDMFLSFEKILLKHLENKSPYFICFTWQEFDELEKARRAIIDHFENNSFDIK